MSFVKSVSILMIFIACIIFTHYFTKENMEIKEKITYRFIPRTFEMDYNNIPLPSKVFKNMFDLPSTWMGQAERDSREAQGKLIKEREKIFNEEQDKINKDRKEKEIKEILLGLEKFEDLRPWSDLENKEKIKTDVFKMMIDSPDDFYQQVKPFNYLVSNHIYFNKRIKNNNNNYKI
jgi:hypothetical protein